MNWYVVDFKMQKTGRIVGMPISGPFKKLAMADQEHDTLKIGGELWAGMSGVLELDPSPNWKDKIEIWSKGDLK